MSDWERTLKTYKGTCQIDSKIIFFMLELTQKAELIRKHRAGDMVPQHKKVL